MNGYQDFYLVEYSTAWLENLVERSTKQADSIEFYWSTYIELVSFYDDFKIKNYVKPRAKYVKPKTQVHNSNANPHCQGYFFVYVVES